MSTAECGSLIAFRARSSAFVVSSIERLSFSQLSVRRADV
ncbi:hypothetical protein HMPREF0183_1553 [Brevibacterium mcbrellneri ATCC 49030]|uniref:Uncharacterized protein n=1 Tax=Brevibacterium mcbrellneri ATCC 49030 TaxID=585530 RepID=D4YNP3_9MICO|nr:hypothetical protein HMPREF0183_1553 [Brevibacterium mcbrellneri ATCC 49030]